MVKDEDYIGHRHQGFGFDLSSRKRHWCKE